MIVVGVDPGARETGVTIVDTSAGYGVGDPSVVESLTISTTKRPQLVNVPPVYLRDVRTAVRDAVASHGAELVAVEGVTKPSGHVRMLDPGAVIAVGIVFGAVIGSGWGVPTVVVRPGGNGSRPWATYPLELLSPADVRAAQAHPLAPAGDGKRRHERSAYDVARQGPRALALARQLGTAYGYAS